MITILQGTIEEILLREIVIRVGPIGLTCFTPSTDSFERATSVTLYTHLYWSQENGPSLYGFNSSLDRAVFLVLIESSGVGPKLALSVLADLGALEFIEAVQLNDAKWLSRVNGIGPKKAEKILVQVKHKIERLLEANRMNIEPNSTLNKWNEVKQVLTSLRYTTGEIDHAIRYLKQEQHTSQMPFDLMMRKALSFLAKKS